jgi:nucleotide-binding universal stress UspA family protein
VVTGSKEEGTDMDERARIVVGVDGSAGSREALRFALQDAARRGGRVEVVWAFQPPDWYGLVDGELTLPNLDEVKASLEAQAQQLVRGVVLEQGGALAAVPVEVVAVLGTPGRVLIEQARAAEMLVVGHRGRGGAASVLLGSVGLYCVFHAPCSVTIVRPAPVPEAVPAPAAAASPVPVCRVRHSA